ncbi:MAG: hypothetical protein AAB647_02130 [Patescibacteria group bacterium]
MLPTFLKPFFWSYDFSQLDIQKHKKIIIGQILNYGTKSAYDWLCSQYAKPVIILTASQIPTGQWNKRSLALWKLVLGIAPHPRSLT